MDVALQIRLQSSLLQDLNDVMDARLKVSQFPWDSRQVKDIWIEMDNSEKTSRGFCCDFCRPSGFTSASWGCSRQHCTDKTPGSYPQALLGEGCGYVQAEFPVNKFSNMLQLWLWAIFQSSPLLFPPFPGTYGHLKDLVTSSLTVGRTEPVEISGSTRQQFQFHNLPIQVYKVLFGAIPAEEIGLSNAASYCIDWLSSDAVDAVKR